MINDKTIDKFSAKYWCVFNNKGFNDILKSLKAEKNIKTIGDIDKKAQAIKTESEAEYPALKMLNEGVVAGATEATLDVMQWLGCDPVGRNGSEKPLEVDVKAVNLSPEQLEANKKRVEEFKAQCKKNGVKNVTYELVQRVKKDPEHWAVKNTKGLHIDGDTEFEFSGYGDHGVTKKTTMNQLNAQIQNDAIGKDAETGFMNNLKSFFGNALGWLATAAGAVAVATLVYKTMPWWSQKLKYAFKKMTSSNSVAYCEFEDAEENEYRCRYDIKKNAWYLEYTSAKLLQNASFPSRETVDQFFATEFFKKFKDRCVQSMNKVMNNDAVKNAVKDAGKKYGDLAKAIDELETKKDAIAENMGGGMYKYMD